MSLADENGVSFWVSGFFGSLAAAPQQAGWSLASIYYHTDVSGERQYRRVPRSHLRGAAWPAHAGSTRKPCIAAAQEVRRFQNSILSTQTSASAHLHYRQVADLRPLAMARGSASSQAIEHPLVSKYWRHLK
jgi:hypothetical protein